MSSIARVKAAAGALGLAIEIHQMDRPTRTAEEAAEACGCLPAQIVKSLIFQETATQRLALLLVSGAHAVDLDFVAAAHGLRLERADIRRVRAETGFAIGGVAPIGHLSPIPVHMDRDLLAHPVVWCAAGRPDSVFAIEPTALRTALAANVIDVAGSVPLSR